MCVQESKSDKVISFEITWNEKINKYLHSKTTFGHKNSVRNQGIQTCNNNTIVSVRVNLPID